MSRTLKDRPRKRIAEFESITKKKKKVDTEWHWMTTPMWWVRLVMNKPKRCLEHVLEKKVLKCSSIEDFDFFNIGKKPYIYYW